METVSTFVGNGLDRSARSLHGVNVICNAIINSMTKTNEARNGQDRSLQVMRMP